MSAVDFFNNDVELPFLQRLCGSKTKRAAAPPGSSSLKLHDGNDSSTRDRCDGLCRGDYARPGAVGPEILVSGLVASIFLAFFKVFLAMVITSSEFGPSSTATRAATGRATALANRNSSAPHGWGHSQGRGRRSTQLTRGARRPYKTRTSSIPTFSPSSRSSSPCLPPKIFRFSCLTTSELLPRQAAALGNPDSSGSQGRAYSLNRG